MQFNFATYDFEADTEFDAVNEDFTRLEIRPSERPNFRYFWDAESNRLIKNFIVHDSPQVRTLMNVTLIEKGGVLEPRVRVWKRAKPGKAAAQDEIPDTATTRSVKASVDVGDGHATFWKLAQFILQMTGADITQETLKLVPKSGVDLADLLVDQDKDALIAAMRLRIGEDLTQADIDLLTDRRGQLEEFRLLLEEPAYFESKRADGHGPEAVWQAFFERNQWIFGYGLSFVACESLTDGKLEQITTGANIFTGGGKRSDAVMKTKGYLSSLLFGEIKTHDTPLLSKSAYRPPDVYNPTRDLVGAVAQVQKTADKAVRLLQQRIHAITADTGTLSGEDVLTVMPRQVLVIGHLKQLEENGAINPERAQSFELFRRSINGLEILTFDELYERTRFIVGPPVETAAVDVVPPAEDDPSF